MEEITSFSRVNERSRSTWTASPAYRCAVSIAAAAWSANSDASRASPSEKAACVGPVAADHEHADRLAGVAERDAQRGPQAGLARLGSGVLPGLIVVDDDGLQPD